MNVARPSLLLSALALGMSLSAQASESPAADAVTTQTQSGSVAGIDPITGKRRALTDAEIRALSERAQAMTPAARSASAAAPNAAWAKVPQDSAQATATIRTHANGVTTAELPMSAMNSLTVERAADGSVQIQENGAPLSQGRQEVSK